MKLIIGTLAALTLLLVNKNTTAQNLLTNGSFENGPVSIGQTNLPDGSNAISSWTVLGELVYSRSELKVYGDGKAAIKATYGGIDYSFSHLPTGNYVLLFDFGGDKAGPTREAQVNATLAGLKSATSKGFFAHTNHGSDTDFVAWKTAVWPLNYSLSANGGGALSIVGLDDDGVYVDDVHLIQRAANGLGFSEFSGNSTAGSLASLEIDDNNCLQLTQAQNSIAGIYLVGHSSTTSPQALSLTVRIKDESSSDFVVRGQISFYDFYNRAWTMTAFNEATLVSDVETPISKSGKGDLTRLVDPGGTLVARVSLGKMPDPKLPPKLPGGPPEPFQPIVVCIDQVKWSTQ